MTGRFLCRALSASMGISALLVVGGCSQPAQTNAAAESKATESAQPAEYVDSFKDAVRPDGTVDWSKLDPAQWVLPPKLGAYGELDKLPDWSGAWSPDEDLQNEETEIHPTPWNEKAAGRIRQMIALHRAGHPNNQNYEHCIPEGMPTWMMIYHNEYEYLFTPGRVTILGESEGNELRRIWTDGRGHPEDPDPTFFGHSIGHWEGETLVVDTVAVMPEVPLSVEEAMGVPNGGDMHIVEHLHVVDNDEMHDDLEITAPNVLSKTWNTTRFQYRQRNRKYEIQEGVCMRGHFMADIDKDGFPVLVALPFDEGIPLGPNEKVPAR